MPEVEFPKIRPKVTVGHVPTAKGPYAELHVTSNFLFLHGGGHPEEFVARAAEQGCRAVAITDINTLAGIVRAHAAAKEMGVEFIVGCHLSSKGALGTLAAGITTNLPPISVLVYPTDTEAQWNELDRVRFSARSADIFRNCLIILKSDSRDTIVSIAKDLGCGADTVIRVRRLAAHRDQIEIYWLPPYCPSLNLIERLWGHLKRTALANVLFRRDLDDLAEAFPSRR